MTNIDPASASGTNSAEPDDWQHNEQDIIRRAQQRDTDASRELVQRFYGKVYKLACRFLTNPEDAKDIAQETFLRAFAAIDRFDLSLSFAPWIRKIAMNLITDAIRARYKKKSVSLESAPEMEDDGSDPTAKPAAAEQKAIVRKLVDALPPKYRTVLVLRDMEGYNVEEVANMLGCPRATVRWRLHQARKIFKHKWERTQPS